MPLNALAFNLCGSFHICSAVAYYTANPNPRQESCLAPNMQGLVGYTEECSHFLRCKQFLVIVTSWRRCECLEPCGNLFYNFIHCSIKIVIVHDNLHPLCTM